MFFELSILGLLIGFISGFFGIGGGTLLVPSLMYLGFGIKYAIGISVLQMTFSSVFGSYLNLRKGSVHIKDGLFLGLGGFLGAQGSGLVVDNFSENTLSTIFLFFILLAIYKFFKAPSINSEKEIDSKILLVVAGAFVGLLAISVGIGGGLLLTPILVGMLRYDLKKAVFMSLFFIAFSSISGLISMTSFGYVDYELGLIVGISSLFGVFFGIKSAHIINKDLHKKLILLLYITILIMTVNKLYF